MKRLIDIQIGKIHVIAEMVPDNHPDLSYLGTFSNNYSEGALEWNEGSRSFKYFIPQPGMEDYAAQNMELMKAYNRGEWFMIGIVSKVYVNGKELGIDSLWGIEYSYSIDDYHREIARDCVHAALNDARTFLESLGA